MVGELILNFVFFFNFNSLFGIVILLEEIVCFVDCFSCFFVVDEVYVDFVEMNCVELIELYVNILVIWMLSKLYGLVGICFGFLLVCLDVVVELSKVKDLYNCDVCLIFVVMVVIVD